jgi:hypothetical protein
MLLLRLAGSHADWRTNIRKWPFRNDVEAHAMPSLLRFLTVVAVIGGLVYGAIFALANFVDPKPREMTISITPDKFLKR